VGVLAAIGIAVGLAVGLSSSGDESTDECDFSGQEQPNVFRQCQCFGTIVAYSQSASDRYQVLLDTVMLPFVSPAFHQDTFSCTSKNLALAWLATDEYSLFVSDELVLTNRLVLALLYQVWSGPSWDDNLGWLSPLSECDWHGISCEGNAIVGLELGDNSLASTTDDNGMPIELFTLTSLSTS
jgi:hypothetical protein